MLEKQRLLVKYRALNCVDKLKQIFRRDTTLLNNMSAESLKQQMQKKCNYVCDDAIVMNIWLALNLKKPLLVEGPPGCGKTELAKVLSVIFESPLIRLQCYDGIDDTKSLYEWNYQKQIIDIQRGAKDNIFSEDYLLERPILSAIRSAQTPILLIDEIDKTDEEFEANLLEVLSDFQVSIPELGTVVATNIPPVILTSNGIRELGDALRRRCIYLYLDYPTIDKEATILMRKVRGLNPKTALDVSMAMNLIRSEIKLFKQPSISESLDLAQALVNIKKPNIDSELINQLSTLFIKNKEDLDKFQGKGGGKWLLEKV
jgi:MoxR-like ATPase